MKNISTIWLAVVLLFWSCERPAEHTAQSVSKAKHAPHWAYTGKEDPAHWAMLSPEFIKCAEGHGQSPIDIRTNGANPTASARHIVFHYRPSLLDIINNGHTIQASYQQASFIQIGDRFFDLKQFHFHTPSEHALNGKKFPMELHLVHADANGELAVVGIFIQEGEQNPAFQPIWEHLPAHADEHFQLNLQVDVHKFLPADHDTYRYEGSLTTPPCTEGVHWYVMGQPISMSSSQIGKFQRLFENNCRPLQPLYDRKILAVQE